MLIVRVTYNGPKIAACRESEEQTLSEAHPIYRFVLRVPVCFAFLAFLSVSQQVHAGEGRVSKCSNVLQSVARFINGPSDSELRSNGVSEEKIKELHTTNRNYDLGFLAAGGLGLYVYYTVIDPVRWHLEARNLFLIYYSNVATAPLGVAAPRIILRLMGVSRATGRVLAFSVWTGVSWVEGMYYSIPENGTFDFPDFTSGVAAGASLLIFDQLRERRQRFRLLREQSENSRPSTNP